MDSSPRSSSTWVGRCLLGRYLLSILTLDARNRSTVHLGAYQLTKRWKMFIRKNWNRISTDRQLRRTCLKPDFLQNDFNVQCWSDDLKWKLLGTKTYLNSVTDSQIREIYYSAIAIFEPATTLAQKTSVTTVALAYLRRNANHVKKVETKLSPRKHCGDRAKNIA